MEKQKVGGSARNARRVLKHLTAEATLVQAPQDVPCVTPNLTEKFILIMAPGNQGETAEGGVLTDERRQHSWFSVAYECSKGSERFTSSQVALGKYNGLNCGPQKMCPSPNPCTCEWDLIWK